MSEPDRISVDEAYMQMAERWAQRSYATRTKVGALIVKDQQIISDGYNGLPRGVPNHLVEIEVDGQLVTNPLVIHAEANCLDKMSKHGSVNGAEGATMYCTISPCLPCAMRIVNNKMKRVVYRTKYRDASPLDWLLQQGVEVVELKETE